MVKQYNEYISIYSELFMKLEEYTESYGYYSVAALIIKYHLLFNSFELYINEKMNEGYSDVEKNLKIVQDHYNSTDPIDRNSNYNTIKVSINEKEAYLFDTEYYYRHYYKYGEHLQNNIFNINQKNTDLLLTKQFYLFVLNKNLEPLIFNEVINIRDFIVGRRDLKVGENRVVHPILLHKYNLIALAAGEIILIKNHKSRRVEGVIINNKSGHYRPSIKTLDVMKDSLAKSLQIPNENILIIYTKGVE